MLGVFANDHNFALALNNLTLIAHGLYGRSYFHDTLPPVSLLDYLLFLLRQVIRPRVKSYGDIWTVTLSPGRMRMKFILSFPEMCAKMTCPFPISTRKVVLGKDSTTVPSSSIMSLFAKRHTSLVITEPISEGSQCPPDFTVQCRLASLHAVGHRVCPDPFGSNVFASLLLGSFDSSVFPVHQIKKISLCP